MHLRLWIRSLLAAFLVAGCTPEPDPEPTVPDAARSTITVDRSTGVTADGLDAAQLTVTALDADGAPVPDLSIVVSATGEDNQLAVATRTDAEGRAEGTLVSTRAGLKRLTVTLVHEGAVLELESHPEVLFVAGPIALSSSSFTAQPSSAQVADGSETTLSLSLRDAFANPVAQQTVTFSVDGAGNTLLPAGELTDADGTLTARLSSSVAETKQVRAAFGDQALSLSLTYQPGPAAAPPSTLSASKTSAAADGADPIVLTATLLDASGNPLPQLEVSLSVTGTGNTLTASTCTTDSTGQCQVQLSSTGAGEKTATAQHDDLVLSTTVRFLAEPPVEPPSSLSASKATATADGVDAITLTATLLDAANNPVVGETVSFVASDASLEADSCTTDTQGQCQTQLTSTLAGEKTVTAQAGALVLSTAVTFFPGPVSAPPSSLVASKPSATADGADAITLTATVLDASGNPLAGQVVPFEASGAGNTLEAASCTTDAQGQCGTQLISTGAGMKVVSSMVGGALLSAAVSFVAGPADAAHCSFTSDRAYAPASGSDAIVFSGTAADANGNPLEGATVTVSSSGTQDTFTPASVVTDSSGVFTFSLTTPRAKSTDTVTATVGSVVLTRDVSFGPSRVHVSAEPSFQQRPLVPLGPGVVASLRDADDQVVTWATHPITVSLAGNAGGLTLAGTVTRTPVDGWATFDDLTVSGPGTSLRVTVGASALASHTSAVFQTQWAWNRLSAPPAVEATALAMAAGSEHFTAALVGTAKGEVFFGASTSGGRMPWERAQGLPGLPIRALAFEPGMYAHAYAGTAGGGVYESDSGGMLWAPALAGLPAGDQRHIHALSVLPGGTAYVGTEGGIFVRAPGGSWTSLNTGSLSSTLAISGVVATPGAVYAATANGQGVHRLALGVPGAVWEPANGGPDGTLPLLPIELMAPGEDSNTLYVVIGTMLFFTDDAGARWRAFPSPTEAPLSVAVAPAGTVFVGTDGAGVQGQSPDERWGTGLAHPIVTALAVDPNLGTLVAGTVGGVWALEDVYSGVWEPWSEGLEGLPLESIAGDEWWMAMGSAAGGGVYVSTDAGATWTVRNAGLTDTHVSGLVFDPGPRRFYAGTREGVFQSADGLTWTPFWTSTAPVAALTLKSGVVHVAGTLNNLWSSADGITATDRSGGTNAPHPGTPTSAGTTGQYLLVGYSDGNLCRQEDAPPLKPWRCAAPTGAPILALGGQQSGGDQTYAGTDGAGAYGSPDATTWSQLSPPHFGVRRVVVSPFEPWNAFLGTEVGVHVTGDLGQTWQEAGNGLPVDEQIDGLWLNPADPLHLRSSVNGILWETFSAGR